MERPRRVLRSNPSRAAKLKRPVRATRSTATYFNSQPSSSSSNSDSISSSDSDSDSDLDSSNSSTSPSPVRRKPPTRKRKNTEEEDSWVPRKALRGARRIIRKLPANVLTPSTPSTTSTPSTPSSSAASPIDPPSDALAALPQISTTSPPWSTLPYHVLLCAFEFVAAPIRDLSSRREDVSEAVENLISAARVCKAFTEPALANLYKCPPFYHRWRYTKDPFTSFSQLVDTLDLSPEDTVINYRTKVELLQIEVGSTLTQKFNANYLSLQDVIWNLPRLSHLEFYHEDDEPPYRKLDGHIRFKCTADELTQTLVLDEKDTPMQLESWRWNSRLTAKSLSLEKLEQFHRTPSFASLRKVAFVNYQLPSWGLSIRVQLSEEKQQQDYLEMTRLSNCISALPALEHLILESSTLVNGSLLNRLPTTLKHLELINCWELTADSLIDFLPTHGNHLQSLTINHCQSLSLAFLPILRPACPNLRHFYMDLSYFRHHEHYADNKPEYTELMTEDQVPTWPSSIQSIEILHMRQWTRKAADTFFESLVQSAPELPQLRRLAFRIALDIGWRQRQDFREFWVDKMARVFKRKATPPQNARMPRPAQTAPRRPVRIQAEANRPKPISVATRRSTRIANISPALTSSESEATQLSKAELVRTSAISRELKRLKGSGLLLKEQRGQDADDEEEYDSDSEDELAADHSDRSRLDRKIRRISRRRSLEENGFIHGLCEVVDIQVDNHRPMERHFDMDDFLDSPEDSDPEWDGGDVDVL
ncbi:hypothetical protein F5Y04DRAFT_246314 [Hypomontagnella monticulosa]|nr:hypothetical protein F5Y04DRAFT_246314 [Hypomontagnella monticulosa]